MQKRRLLRELLSPYLLTALAALAVLLGFAVWAIEEREAAEFDARLREQAEWFALQVGDAYPGDAARLQTLCERYGKVANARVTLIDSSGTVVSDTLEDPKSMPNHKDRPEVRRALLDGATSAETRYSETADRRLKYIAAPIVQRSRVVAVVRMAVDPASVVGTSAASWRLILAGLAIAMLAGAIIWWLGRCETRTIDSMTAAAAAFSAGRLYDRVPAPTDERFAKLGETLNGMAERLEAKIEGIMQRSQEQETVLSSMIEGVLAVDRDERIISMNAAASRLIGVKLTDVQGRGLQEVIRNADLRRFVAHTLESSAPVAGDIVLRHDRDLVLQANGAALRDAKGRSIGAVIVLNDVTRQSQLETMRRDFAANVSHELRTPITSIKGFVETLLDGALHNTEDAERFLRIIARHADRLNAIIDDLISLSKLEREAESSEIAREPGAVADVLREAVLDCEAAAAEHGVTVRVACPADLYASVNAQLLEQAVANLIDNAVKYSESGREVRVEAEARGPTVAITVTDEGCGIGAEHLPRLFERFYRVDRARSRKGGGAGLGLAIVKHIVHAHDGKVDVTSTPGQGSTFTILLQRIATPATVAATHLQ